MKILVTGTSRGLGKSIAEFLSNKGHTVVGCARGEIDHSTFQHISGIDFLTPDSFTRLDEELTSSDVLINNAAVAFDGLLATQGEQSIHDLIQVNLTSTLLLTKRYVRQRLKHKLPGIILNISSIISVRGYAGLAVYAASKAGIDGMTRALARELGGKKFRVNSILPGYMETDMSKALDTKQKDKIIHRTPLARLATMEDITPVVEFLISDASRFITGQSLVVDGGITV